MERNLRGFLGWFFWKFYGRNKGGSVVTKEKRNLEEGVHSRIGNSLEGKEYSLEIIGMWLGG